MTCIYQSIAVLLGHMLKNFVNENEVTWCTIVFQLQVHAFLFQIVLI